MGKEIPLVSLLCGVLGRKKTPPEDEAGKQEDSSNGDAAQIPGDAATKPAAANGGESTEDQARDTAQTTSNDQQVPLPPPPGKQQYSRALSFNHPPERSHSMASKLVSSLSMRVSNGMAAGRQFSRREEKPRKLKPEDSIWKKTIILGERCKVPDHDEDSILYDEKGNRIAAFHQKTPSPVMSFSRHTTVPTACTNNQEEVSTK
ncbi:hypothetical protein Salat_2911000 [Sesamum alatum]|uniref:Uncharacterized protein n=1 Tax=Sesamum alatum TaxID=300844 RepID=A0AAE2C863_9LAMI|nr:hypothetical protein Salat_2911000 [Sesamum alatum]